MIGLINPEQLPAGTQIELEGLVKRLNALLAVEHNDDGTHRLGLFTTVTYNPGLYQTTTAGVTWTVLRGSQVTCDYTQIGELVTVHLVVQNSSTNGGSPFLIFNLPNNFTAPVRQEWTIYYNDGAVSARGGATIAAMGKQLAFYRDDFSNWPAASGTLNISGTFQIRVA